MKRFQAKSLSHFNVHVGNLTLRVILKQVELVVEAVLMSM